MAVKARDKWRADEAEINKKEIYKEQKVLDIKAKDRARIRAQNEINNEKKVDTQVRDPKASMAKEEEKQAQEKIVLDQLAERYRIQKQQDLAN